MLDAVKDYLAPKTFGVVAYTCLIVHILCGVTFTAVTWSLRTIEFGKFSCAFDTESTAVLTRVEKDCFDEYDKTYNSPLPLYGFTILTLGFPVLVSVIYSHIIRKRVEEMEEEIERISNGSDQPRVEANRGFRVLYSYFFHLVVRSLFGILFTVLQHTVFYPGGFHSKFICNLPTTDAGSQITTASNASVGTTGVLNSTSIIACENSTASEKELWGIFVTLLNAFVALIIFIEMIYLWRPFSFLNCRSEDGWSNDTEFITDYFLRKRLPQQIDLPLSSLQDSIDFYKQQILNAPRTPNICYAPNTDFDDLYIDVVINTGRALHKFSKYMKRHEMYDVYMRVPQNSIRLEKTKDLFYPNTDTKGEIPRTILAVGRPGIGKTVLTERIIRDWANKVDGFYDGKIVFSYTFRWFNIHSEFQNISPKTFLRYGTGLNEEQFEFIFDEILKNPKNAIFIFDGLDEYDGDFIKCLDQLGMLPNELNTCMPAMMVFMKLVFGKILKGATVLVTSRPTANDLYSRLNCNRSVEVIGFTSDKIEQYVNRFCDNSDRSDLKPHIWNHINSSSDLLNLCYIPVNCFIVCVTLSECLSDPGNDIGALPTTMTGLYKTAINHFGQYHDRNSEETEQSVKKLQKLAFHGTKNGQLVFNNEQFNEQMKKSGLVNSLSYPIFPLRTQFCFIHLTIQEFLAAKHVIETLPPDEIRTFISANIKNGKWRLVLQFIAGLLGEKVKMFGSDYQGCVLAFAKTLLAHNNGELDFRNDDHPLVIKYLREVDDEDIVKQACNIHELNHVTKIVGCGRTASHWAAVAFVCKHLKNLTHFRYIDKSKSKDNCLLEIAKLLQQSCLETLELSQPKITASDSAKEHLIGALMNSRCKLNHKHVNLSVLQINIQMTDKCLSTICEFIKNGHASRLRELDLADNKLTSSGISHLGKVLNAEFFRELTILNLARNAIGDEGVTILCNDLIQGHCKLNKLDLDRCSLTTECVPCLCKVLCDEHCELTDLTLSQNAIRYEGVRTLCTDALRREQCRLTTLSLEGCGLQDQCVPLLCKTLKDGNCKLAEFYLAGNIFSRKGKSLILDADLNGICKL